MRLGHQRPYAQIYEVVKAICKTKKNYIILSAVKASVVGHAGHVMLRKSLGGCFQVYKYSYYVELFE